MNTEVAKLDRADVLGTWQLISVEREELPSGKTVDLLGPDPHGYINYGDDGRMLVLIVGHDRTRPAGKVATDAEAASLFRSMVSYGGTWEFDGTTMLHLVDISWGESWTGTRQKRRVTIAGDNLVLSSGPDPDPIDGVYSIRRMTWRRLPASTT